MAPTDDQRAQSPIAPREARRPRRGLARIAPRYWIALALYVTLCAFFVHDWDGFVFERSVRDFYNGYSPYTIAEEAPFYTFLNDPDARPQWYAYPPLPLLAMSVTFLPEHFFDVSSVAERVLLKLPMVLGTLALAVVGGAWARHLGTEERTRVRVERLLLFNPFLVLVGPVWGMTDPALVAFFLAGALRFAQGRHYGAGAYFALSALIKPFPILLAIPLVAYYVHVGGWRPVGRAVATAVPLATAVVLPFLASNPQSFYMQVVGVHLQRDPQGLTIWSVAPLSHLSTGAIGAASLTLISASMLILSFIAPRLRGGHAPFVLLFATSTQVLLWNRVVNEQYLTLVVAPLLILYALGHLPGPGGRRLALYAPLLFFLVTVFQGFHFIRFIPPDVEALLWPDSRDVTVIANRIRNFFDWGLENPFPNFTPALFVGGVLLILAWVALRQLWQAIDRRPETRSRFVTGTTVSAAACLVVLMLGFTPLVSPITVVAPPPFEGTTDRPLVGAFYYLWWNNPAHDPNLDSPYGNWADASQFPELGYYTQTRGVARVHAQMMRENGIDVAIVSYHTGELGRYKVFQEEAAQKGLLVAPLIELNQVYDRPQHRPLNETYVPVQHAAYRLANETRITIEDFVLQLTPLLQEPSTYRVDGRPVIFFYDSYVSGVGFGPEDRETLARKLLEIKPLEYLRFIFDDPALQPNVSEVLRHYPERKVDDKRHPPRDMFRFYEEGNKTLLVEGNRTYEYNQSAVWREAHLELHREFWEATRANLEARLGPLFLVSGDAFNERAGFEAGTIKSLTSLDVFDGSFIYSPSFTWGTQPRDDDGSFNATHDQIFELWVDRNLWLTAFGEGAGKYTAFGVAPSYNDIPKRGPIKGFEIPAELEPGVFLYDMSWESVLRHRPDLVVLATFNEFFEGSSVEPSTTYSARFINQTLAYRERLRQAPDDPLRVLSIVHERSSRLNPRYSEMDNPHWWGLKLVAAAGHAYGGSADIVALDAMERNVSRTLASPDLILMDGGRDDYNASAFSPEVLERLQAWSGQGVPTVVLGREVAPTVRDLFTPTCRANGPVPLGRAVVPNHIEDQLAPGHLVSAETGGRLSAESEGAHYTIGYRCADRPHLAFTTIKPWTVTDRTDEPPSPSDPACLATFVRAFFPTLAPATATGQCTTTPYAR